MAKGASTMSTAKVKIDKALLDKIKKYAEMSGYSSTEEFIAHCLEKEVAKIEQADSEEEVKKKLKGLGYIG
jgi:metal-responsive CopG/Arc/MetJ family transcriptional regulator